MGEGRQSFSLLEKVALKEEIHTMALVAVNGSSPYWFTKGFSVPEMNEALKAKLLTYSDDALYMVKTL